MNKIKFRVWDKVNNIMLQLDNENKEELIDLFENAVDLMGLGFQYYPNTEWMLSTGLKDKNGKEIYEGDILLFNNDYPNAQKADWKCVVKYRKGSFVCEYPKDGVYNHFDSWNVPKVTWEVIGNICEHPHLLEVQHD